MDICLHTIFQITEKYIGGTERFLISYAKELNNLGYNAFIVCTSFNKSYFVEGIQVYGVVPIKYQNVAKTYESLSSKFINNEIIKNQPIEEALLCISEYTDEQLRNINADFYHLNSFISAAYLKPSLRNYIIYNHENDKEINSCYGSGFFEKFADIVRLKKTYLHELQLYTPSKYYSLFYQKALDCKVNSVKLGVNLIDFKFSEKTDALKQEVWDTSDGYIILLPSRFKIEQKGHDIALKAIHILIDKGVKFKLLITGIKPHELNKVQQFMNYTREIGVDKYVLICSYDDINVAYQNCDCVISPERYCSYGLSISESLSLGIPTIMNTIPTYEEIGINYQHAHFFQNDDYVDLANILQKLIEDKKLIRNRAGAIKFRSNNDIRECAKSFSNIYLSK